MSVRRLVRKAEAWFAKNQRPLPWRETYDPYQVWVSEVMLQQTRMEVVLRYYSRFLQRFPTLLHLARASHDQVTALWSGLGYYRRARMLRDGAVAVRRQFGGRLPESVGDLMSIPGIGRYTAGAISSIAYDRVSPVVDGNITRILERLYSIRSAARAWRKADELVRAAESPRLFNQALMEIGALICKPKSPACSRCPLRTECRAFARGRTALAPRRRMQSRAVALPLIITTDARGRILMRRENGLYVLPSDGSGRRRRTGTFRHTIMDRRITFTVFLGSAAGKSADQIWIDPAQLGKVPHPSYVRKALQVAGIGNL